LQADGVSARLDMAQKAPATAGSSLPWSVRIAGARPAGIREIGLGEFLLSGNAQAETTFFYGRNGTLAVDRAAIAMSAGTFQVNGESAAQDLAFEIETRIEPSVLGRPELLHSVSGTGNIRGRISSLGFLRPYLQKAPWLAIQGQGGLKADVRLDHGRLAPGSRLSVSASPVRATIFDSLAPGNGGVSIAVEPGKTAPLTSMQVRFEQFGLVDLQRKGR